MRKFLFNQKFRFDLGYSFLGLINFSLLLITASDKIKPFLKIERTSTFVIVAVLGGFFGVWLFGFFLDRVMRYNQNYSDAQHSRNPHAKANYDRLIRIEEIVKSLVKENQ